MSSPSAIPALVPQTTGNIKPLEGITPSPLFVKTSKALALENAITEVAAEAMKSLQSISSTHLRSNGSKSSTKVADEPDSNPPSYRHACQSPSPPDHFG